MKTDQTRNICSDILSRVVNLELSSLAKTNNLDLKHCDIAGGCVQFECPYP